MTVAELKTYIEDLDDGVEVRLMTQETYPFENKVIGCVTKSDLAREKAYRAKAEEEDYEDREDEDSGEVVYLVEGRQIGYGTSLAWEIL